MSAVPCHRLEKTSVMSMPVEMNINIVSVDGDESLNAFAIDVQSHPAVAALMASELEVVWSNL